MTRDEYYDSLYHHGIMKQKWGVRHGPPYPLSYSKHSSAQKKSNPKSVIDGKEETTSKNQNGVSNNKDENKGLTDKQKKAILVGAGITAGVLAACGGVYLYKHSNLKNELGKEFIDDLLKGSGSSFNKLGIKTISGFHDISDDCAKVNFKNKNLMGSQTNCLMTSIAHELRRRGADVTAGLNIDPKSGMVLNERHIKELPKLFSGDFIINCSKDMPLDLFDNEFKSTEFSMNKTNMWTTFDEMGKILKEQPNGSRGILRIGWKSGGGHFINYEISAGELVFSDAQNGNVYNASNVLRGLNAAANTEGTWFIRTDQLQLDIKDKELFNLYIRR